MKNRFVFGALALVVAVVAASVTVIASNARSPREHTLQFTRSTNIDPQAFAALQGFVDEIVTEPRFRFVVTGHTGTDGDSVANTELSERRAERAAEILRQSGVAAERIVTVQGRGGDAPFDKPDGISNAEYQRSLARVEIRAFFSEW